MTATLASAIKACFKSRFLHNKISAHTQLHPWVGQLVISTAGRNLIHAARYEPRLAANAGDLIDITTDGVYLDCTISEPFQYLLI